MSLRLRIVLAAAIAAFVIPRSSFSQESTPAAAKKPDTAVVAAPIAAADLEALTGFYEIMSGRGLTITLEKGSLYGAPSNGEKRKLTHQTGTAYAVEGTAMTLTFILGPDGKATDIIMTQNGRQRMLKRI